MPTEPSAPLVIRPVAATDFPQWAPLWEGYNTFYKRTLPDEITRVTWARFFDETEPVHALVAEQDGRLLGLVHYLFHRATAMIELSCYLSDLFTSEAARGKGVGRALIEAVYEKARARAESTGRRTKPTASHRPSTKRSPNGRASSSTASRSSAARHWPIR
jgi:GNAT superfamily N-acetyltransferase